MIHSIRFKTTILYSGILCVILVCFSSYLYHSVRRILYQNLEQELTMRADQIVGTIAAYGEMTGGHMPAMSLMRQFLSDQNETPLWRGAMDKLWERHRFSLGAHNDFFRVVNANGEVIMQSEDLPSGASREFDRTLPGSKDAGVFVKIFLNGAAFRELNYPFTFNYRQPLTLQLAMPLAPVDRALSRLLAAMIVAVTAILLLSLFIGSFLTKRILWPVMEVTRAANNISQRNLGVRISEQSLDQEMRVLVASFNQMIGRLEKSFAHINEFSSHVAHELKTPLAIIKGELEIALSREDISPESRQVMMVTLQEVNRLIRIIKDLLLIAKFDYRLDIFKMAPLELGAFLKEVHQHAAVLAGEKGVRLYFSAPERDLPIQGDAVHLRRLFFNLIHNAVKFTPSGGEVRLEIDVTGRSVRVDVKDTGIGIAPEDQDRIFEKFFRGRQQIQLETPGTGLGLSLARSIARAHGGDISFESKPAQGTTFTVILPLV